MAPKGVGSGAQMSLRPKVLKGVAFFGDRVGLRIVYITDNGDSRRLNLD